MTDSSFAQAADIDCDWLKQLKRFTAILGLFSFQLCGQFNVFRCLTIVKMYNENV